MAVADKRYEVEVPDTLDLAERAALAINALTGAAEPRLGYETYHGGHLDHRPAFMSLRASGPCLMKPVHVLPMMRIMSGSEQNANYDREMMEACLREVEDDGLWWLKIEGRPWRKEVFGEDHVCITSDARLIVALLDWHKYDENPRWLSIAERMLAGLTKIAARKDNRAWYPYSMTRTSWRGDVSPSAAITGDAKTVTPGEPDEVDIYTNGNALRAFAVMYAEGGDKKALEMAHRLARFMLKTTTGPNEPDWPSLVPGRERGFWYGHFHSCTCGMMGLAEYAIATGDPEAVAAVCRFYEWARHFGISRIGFFPAVIGSLAAIGMGAEGVRGMPSEPCGIGEMTWLAARLSEAGFGDYWEDVDQYTRNHLIETQWVRRDLLEAMVAAGEEHTVNPRMETAENAVERNIGAFPSAADPTAVYGWWTMCCNANMPIGLYLAWRSIVEATGNAVKVNLLLNRASQWMDIDSYLPYEGKVILRNKLAKTAYVRLPRGVDRRAVQISCSRAAKHTHYVGNHLVVENLAPDESVTIEFPMVETVEKHTEPSFNTEYTCTFKGNTLIDISPKTTKLSRDADTSDDGTSFIVPPGYPLYLRDHYKQSRAPIKKVQRFVSGRII